MKAYIPPDLSGEFHRWDWIKIRPNYTDPTRGVTVMTCVMHQHDEAERITPLIRTFNGWYNPETKLMETIAPTHYAYNEL